MTQAGGVQTTSKAWVEVRGARHVVRLIIASVIVFLMASVATTPIYASPIVDTNWRQDGAGVGSWNRDPESGMWTSIPIGVDLDPFGYRFELVCTGHDGFVDVQCRVINDICDDGEDGQLVQWYRGLRALGSSAWTEEVGNLTCIYAAKPENVLERIAARIESDFKSLPIDAGATAVQPAPHTLIGAHTNVYAEAAEQRFNVQILGQDVSISATPVEYSWNYGDGSSLGPTAAPGGPLPQDRWGERTATSHVYKDTGDFQVVLTTAFSGTYSVNGGPAVPIPGNGSFAAEPVTISVWRSTVNNYADNCLENPKGAAC